MRKKKAHTGFVQEHELNPHRGMASSSIKGNAQLGIDLRLFDEGKGYVVHDC